MRKPHIKCPSREQECNFGLFNFQYDIFFKGKYQENRHALKYVKRNELIYPDKILSNESLPFSLLFYFTFIKVFTGIWHMSVSENQAASVPRKNPNGDRDKL